MNQDPEFWKQVVPIGTTMLAWMAIHGNLCLALRHPGNDGDSRAYVVEFVKALGLFLVDSGAITQAELNLAEKTEILEGSRDLL